MQLFVRAVKAMSQVCGVISGLLIAAAVVIVCQMVFLRKVLNENTIWQTDFVTYSLVAATFLGAPYVLMKRGHVNVDIVPLYVGQAARYRLALFSIFISLIFCVIITWLAIEFWYEAWRTNEVSNSMWRARLWIHYTAMPLGLGILTLQYIADLINLVTGRDYPFGLSPETKL